MTFKITESYLLSVGADTANEERLRSVQSLQEFGQRCLQKSKKRGLLKIQDVFGLFVCVMCKLLSVMLPETGH